jgi:hypothetical protein
MTLMETISRIFRRREKIQYTYAQLEKIRADKKAVAMLNEADAILRRQEADIASVMWNRTYLDFVDTLKSERNRAPAEFAKEILELKRIFPKLMPLTMEAGAKAGICEALNIEKADFDAKAREDPFGMCIWLVREIEMGLEREHSNNKFITEKFGEYGGAVGRSGLKELYNQAKARPHDYEDAVEPFLKEFPEFIQLVEKMRNMIVLSLTLESLIYVWTALAENFYALQKDVGDMQAAKSSGAAAVLEQSKRIEEGKSTLKSQEERMAANAATLMQQDRDISDNAERAKKFVGEVERILAEINAVHRDQGKQLVTREELDRQYGIGGQPGSG